MHHSGRPHTIDSLINGKTRGAITAFLGDRGIIAAAGISPALTAEIAKAKGEGWSRPVAPKRAYATAKDIAPKVEAVKQNAWSRFWSKVLAVPSTAGAATWGVVSNIPAANDAASPYIAKLGSAAPRAARRSRIAHVHGFFRLHLRWRRTFPSSPR